MNEPNQARLAEIQAEVEVVCSTLAASHLEVATVSSVMLAKHAKAAGVSEDKAMEAVRLAYRAKD